MCHRYTGVRGQGYCTLETPGEVQGDQSNQRGLPGRGWVEKLDHSGSTEEVRPKGQ